MSSLRPTLSDSSKWELIISESKKAVIIDPRKNIHLPITPIEIPIQIENTAIALFTDTENRKTTWKCGGWLSIRVNTGITVGGNQDAEIGNFFLRLERINIIRIPTLANSYSLIIDVPYWFRSLEYSLWEYTGEGIADIEGKLDQINRLIEIN